MTLITHVHPKKILHNEVRHIVYGWLFVFMCVGLWELAYYCMGKESQFFSLIVPPPSHIVSQMIEKWDLFYPHLLATFLRTALSIIAALMCSIPLGYIMAVNEAASTLSQGLFLMMQSIPSFCLTPILIVWFGWGIMPVFIPAFIAALLPLTINVFRGLKTEDPILREYFTVMKATVWQRFTKLSLPTVRPYLFSGLRIAVAGSGMATVAGEWAGANIGLGVLLIELREQMDLPLMFACIALISGISAFLYGASFIIEMATHYRFRLHFAYPPQPLKKQAKRKGLPLFGILVFAALLGCTSCSSRSDREDERKAVSSGSSKVTLMLDWTPCPTHIPLFYGIDAGCFKEQGIDLSIIRSGASDALQLVSSSSTIDAVISHMPRTIRLHEKNGFDVKVIGVLVNRPLNGFLARRDKISTVQDIDGKRLGFSGSKYSSQTLDILLKSKGITPAEKYNVRLDLLPQLIMGNVDIIWGAYSVIEPYQMRAFGVDPIFFSVEEFGMPSYPELIVVSSRTGLFSDPGLVCRFQKALQKSIDLSTANPIEAIEVYFKRHPEKGIKTKRWEKNAWKALLPYLTGGQKLDYHTDIAPLAAWLYDQKIVSHMPQLHSLVSDVIVEEASASLTTESLKQP